MVILPLPRRFARPAPRPGEQGYNLVVLMVLVTVMNVAVAVALPAWSSFARREKEAEAIFRGLQYAEAIRVFQKRHARLPTTLEELIEIEPRAIRKLYPNPLNESGEWGLLIQSAAPPARGARGGAREPRGGVRQPITPPGQRFETPQAPGPGINPGLTGGAQGRYVAVPPGDEDGEESGFRGATRRTTGPIVGVYPAVDEPSQRFFFGQDNYSAWHFTVSLIPLPVVVGDRALPRVTSEWIGKPFREDVVSPPDGEGPGSKERGNDRDRDDDRGRDRKRSGEDDP